MKPKIKIKHEEYPRDPKNYCRPVRRCPSLDQQERQLDRGGLTVVIMQLITGIR